MSEYIFAYGSLINEKSRKETGNTGQSMPATLLGYGRVWTDAPRFDISLPTVIKEEGAYCNGVLFSVEDLKPFDKREEGYGRIRIDSKELKTHGQLDADVVIWLYVWNMEKITTTLPTYLSYVDVILSGCLKISKEFAQEFINTTLGWPRIVNDRKKPHYPRALPLIDTAKVDELLENVKTYDKTGR